MRVGIERGIALYLGLGSAVLGVLCFVIMAATHGTRPGKRRRDDDGDDDNYDDYDDMMERIRRL